MAQTFYPITPTEIVAPGAADWETMDASAVVPADATGVILHIVDTAITNLNVGIRKPGSTDDRRQDMGPISHWWAMIGVDANRYFEAYVGSTTDIDIYVVGYTMAGVTFATNADDMSLGDTGDWEPIDSSTEAPSAIGLIWHIESSSLYEFGFRKNGSSDDRHPDGYLHYSLGAIIGCDASQICEGYIENTGVDFFLVGYITDGATFNLNATDESLGSTGSYIDLGALPAGANMGFIEVISMNLDYGLRKNGQSGGYYDIYYGAYQHPWAIVECDASRVIEGKIESTNVDFFVVGYSTAVALFQQAVGGGSITPTGALSLKIMITTGQGAITPTGALNRLIKILIGQGGITPAGSLGRKISISVGGGSITPVGVLVAALTFFQNVGQGAITAVGTLGRKISLAVGSGSITPVGVLGRTIKIAVGAGSITPTGALTAIRKIFVSAGQGIITPIGTLGRKISISVGSGSITPAGILGRFIKIAVGSGAITPTGALGLKFKMLVGQGVITPVGVLGLKIKIAVGSGVITPVGSLVATLVGKVLKVVVLTAHYRYIKALTAQYRQVKLVTGLYRGLKVLTGLYRGIKVVTSLYRRIKTITSGGQPWH